MNNLPQTDKASTHQIPYQPLVLERLTSIGAIEPIGGMLTWEDVERVDKILRLRNFFGVNLTGATIIVELMDRLETLEEKISYPMID
jgi:MerR family transcriptional regulator, heat shock protein HspR